MYTPPNKLVTNNEWKVIYKTEATELAQSALEDEYGPRRFLPAMLIKAWCKENLRSSEWTSTRPYFNPAKLLINHYSRSELKQPPVFFMFDSRSVANEVKDKFSHLFEFTEVNSNSMESEACV